MELSLTSILSYNYDFNKRYYLDIINQDLDDSSEYSKDILQ